MKKFILLVCFIQIAYLVQAQYPSGKIIYDQLYSAALENTGGENPTRSVTIYLPPDYDETTNRYPVIYFLHGYADDDKNLVVKYHFDKLLDKAIAKGIIKPVIIVMPDHYTLYRGSFYANSSLTGNWADFTAKDLVTHVDQNYRSIPDRESRGISGHSMGGHGAIRIGMLYPDVFASVYGVSPAALGIANEIGPKSRAYKSVTQLKTREELAGYSDFYPNILVAMGRAFSPNLNKPPFYADLPFTYKGNSLIINYKVLALWNKNLPIGMVDDYVDNLNKLKALKFDWGRNEENLHIPITCRIFSEKLENLGINHYAEEYIGTHSNKIMTDDGRLLNDVFPFFNTYLKFE